MPRHRVPHQLFSSLLLLSGLALSALPGKGQEEDFTPSSSSPPSLSSLSTSPGPIYRIPITGVIEMGLAPYVERVIEEANKAGASVIVLDIDTPGGRIDAAESISGAVADSDIPILALINRRALSAGALIALSADHIYMRPGSVLGAATPVTGEGQKASEKVVSAMRSEFRALAQARGLDPRVAEAMVDEGVAIEGVVESGSLLTLSTEEAANLRYAERIEDWEALVRSLELTNSQVIEPPLHWTERLVRVLTHPLVAPLLLSLGFMGLLIEMHTPTFGLAGLAGFFSLSLFFGSHLILGLAGWEVLILLAVGIMLLGVEAFVLPGFGISGILGMLAIAASIFLSLIGNWPTTGDIITSLFVILAAFGLTALLAWQLVRRLPADRRARALLHLGRMTKEEGYTSNPSREDLLGQSGLTTTDLRPAGTARFGEESIDVVSGGAWIPAGTWVRVVKAEGYRHVVEPQEQGSEVV